ncbi:MAG: hypothetical protein AAGG02_05555 [Cyanobacteria bacterium P01_H01_bin.15]
MMNRLSLVMPFLLLTSVLSFLVPLVLVGLVLVIIMGLSHLPGVAHLGQASLAQTLTFLELFGEGSVLQGVLTLGFASSGVGVLFAAFNSY